MGYLAIAHAAYDLGHELGDDLRPLEPVGRGEGLCTEGDTAVVALKPADTLGFSLAAVVAEVFPFPAWLQVVVVHAGGGWTVGKNPGRLVSFIVIHAGETA